MGGLKAEDEGTPGSAFPTFLDLRGIRENTTKDIAKREVVISSENVVIENFPVSRPAAIFNPSVALVDDTLKIYARVVIGYYRYVSGIVELDQKEKNGNKWRAKIVIYPDTKYDVTGAEDPRVYWMDNKLLMTYTGRTHNYFIRGALRRTIPVTAVLEKGEWVKKFATDFGKEVTRKLGIVSNKDAFFVRSKDGVMFFHRSHDLRDRFSMLVSSVDGIDFNSSGLNEVSIKNTREILLQERFEDKVGWGTPPLEIDGKLLLFLHAVERELESYSVFAMLINKNNMEVEAITPFYIMSPREPYELFGDNSLTIFPCGAVKVDDSVLISYGAADYFACLARIHLDELMHILDKGMVG